MFRIKKNIEKAFYYFSKKSFKSLVYFFKLYTLKYCTHKYFENKTKRKKINFKYL